MIGKKIKILFSVLSPLILLIVFALISYNNLREEEVILEKDGFYTIGYYSEISSGAYSSTYLDYEYVVKGKKFYDTKSITSMDTKRIEETKRFLVIYSKGDPKTNHILIYKSINLSSEDSIEILNGTKAKKEDIMDIYYSQLPSYFYN